MSYNKLSVSFYGKGFTREFAMIEADEQESIINETDAPEEVPAELRESRWSVISFEKCEANNLTYAEAEQKLEELLAQKVSGLCIVTNEVAERI
ncbi:hypothetical protein BH10ACI1_BH10ACI1_20970 [soil metagenome]